MSEDQILDHPMNDDGGKKYVKSNLASGGKRFANYLIDMVIFYILVFVFAGFFAFMFPNSVDAIETYATLWSLLMMVTYYWVMETLTGKTVGKFITRTKIVKEDGSKPEALNILGRSFSRMIPFDAFSYLGNSGRGWHDSIPDIYVIDDKQ